MANGDVNFQLFINAGCRSLLMPQKPIGVDCKYSEDAVMSQYAEFWVYFM